MDDVSTLRDEVNELKKVILSQNSIIQNLSKSITEYELQAMNSIREKSHTATPTNAQSKDVFILSTSIARGNDEHLRDLGIAAKTYINGGASVEKLHDRAIKFFKTINQALSLFKAEVLILNVAALLKSWHHTNGWLSLFMQCARILKLL